MNFPKLAQGQPVYGNASGTPDQILHLLLCPALEKHEYKNKKGQGPELTECRMLVPVPPLEWERDVLYQDARAVRYGADHCKLSRNFQHQSKPRTPRLERWRQFIEH